MKFVTILCALLVTASTGTGQVFQNDAFASGLDYWYVGCPVDWVLHPQTVGTVRWDSSYAGSARMIVSGSPGSVDLFQATHASLHVGDIVSVAVYACAMPYGTFSVTIGDPDSGGQSWSITAPARGLHIVPCTLALQHAPGTSVLFGLITWPGACTCYVEDVTVFPYVGVEDVRADKLRHPSILTVRPNPVAYGTELAFNLDRTAVVSLAIYDESGALVRRLMEGSVQAGHRAAVWDGRDESDNLVGKGTYFARLRTEYGVIGEQKVILTK